MTLLPRIGTLIGFAAKSRTLLLGEFSVENGIKSKKAKVVILAEDVNLRRREILQHWCRDMDISFLALGTKEDFGKLLNKKPLGLLAVTDAKLAEAICQAAQSNGGD